MPMMVPPRLPHGDGTMLAARLPTRDPLQFSDSPVRIQMLGSNTATTGVFDCSAMDGGVVRLGVPAYMHLVS
jgi:hypothetical protein